MSGAMRCRWSRTVGAALAAFGVARAGADDSLRFNRDVLPILAENCFACHGDISPSEIDNAMEVMDWVLMRYRQQVHQ